MAFEIYSGFIFYIILWRLLKDRKAKNTCSYGELYVADFHTNVFVHQNDCVSLWATSALLADVHKRKYIYKKKGHLENSSHKNQNKEMRY